MAEFPALPMLTDAYIADTQHLTNEEHGVYLRLLMFAWRTPRCCLPDDDKRLALMVGVTAKKWASLKPVVMDFWTLRDGAWRQKKLTSQRQFVERQREQKVAAGEASARARSLKTNEPGAAAVGTGGPTAEATAPQQSKSITNKEVERGKPLSCARFQDFWDAYPHRAKRKRADAEKKYARAVKDGVSEQTLIDAARRHHGDRSVIDGYARDAVTWLNQKGWEDEPEPAQLRVVNGGPDGKPTGKAQARFDAFMSGARLPS